MATTCQFRGQTLGSGVLVYRADTVPGTPPVPLHGLGQAAAGWSSESRNLQHGLEVTLYVIAADQHSCSATIEAILQLVGLSGVVRIKEGATTKVLTDANWVLAEAPPPEVAAGFGGRWTDQLVLRFRGQNAPQRY